MNSPKTMPKFPLNLYLNALPLSLLLAGLAAVPVHAQLPPPPVATPPIRAVSVTPNYQIAAGDVLSVNVVNFTNLSSPQAMVAPDGTISLPLLDQVSVAGLTTVQATRLLAARWKRYVINPAVTVSLMQKHAQTVVLNGSLNHTGTIDYRPNLRLLEALAQMGGSLSTADATKAVLTHADGTKQALDLSHPETKADDPEINLVLQPGDVLYIPEQKGKISVTGEVKQPGSIYYKENTTVLDAISASGGINSETADLNEATLTHDGATRKLDLDALLRKGDIHANAMLASGDTVNIPELHNRTYVFGDVGRPGYYYYKPGDHILDALNSAGVQPDADTGKINVIHTNKDKTVSQMVRVNADDFLLRGNISGNPAVQPGDSLYIPKKHESFNGNTILQVLSGVGAVANTGRVLQGR